MSRDVGIFDEKVDGMREIFGLTEALDYLGLSESDDHVNVQSNQRHAPGTNAIKRSKNQYMARPLIA